MSWDSLLTSQETRLFSHLFQFVSKTQDGIVTGPEAVQFFATSGVPNEILSEVIGKKNEAVKEKKELKENIDLGGC